MIYSESANLSGRLLAGSIGLDNRLVHYICVRILCPRLYNLAQLTESDIIVMWAFLTRRNIDWGHFVRFCMMLAKKDGEPLPFASLVTCILEHINVPLDGETVE